LKPWRGGMPTAVVMRKGNLNWRIIKNDTEKRIANCSR
jgi:hypothetical protein